MRAQVAIEYVLIAMAATFVLTALLVTAQSLNQQAQRSLQEEALEDIANQLQEEILLAASLRDGYNRSVQLPVRANKQPWDFAKTHDGFELSTSTHQTSRRTPEFFGEPTSTRITITKQNSEVYVS